ncbi:SRC kinase signaling inhibitor 1 [Eumetopias jubatus]|nr:SRC kinase signaling inhibitor 1 [Eumetopias jubatus]
MASAIKDEDDEDRIIAELEVFERSSVSSLPPTPRRQPIPTLLAPQDLGPPGGSAQGPTWKSGGGSVPPMKVVTPGASRLKAVQSQAGSPDKGKHGKQRAEYMRIQAQQQATKPSKEMSGSNETSSPVSEKPSASRTSIPVLTSFGARNSSISF